MFGEEVGELGDGNVAEVSTVLLEKPSSREGFVGCVGGSETLGGLVERERRESVARVRDRSEETGEGGVEVGVFLIREGVGRGAGSGGLMVERVGVKVRRSVGEEGSREREDERNVDRA